MHDCVCVCVSVFMCLSQQAASSGTETQAGESDGFLLESDSEHCGYVHSGPLTGHGMSFSIVSRSSTHAFQMDIMKV